MVGRYNWAAMATLTIEDLPDAVYDALLRRAEQQHRTVAEEALQILSSAAAPTGSRSILELRGLGKDCWAGIDAAAHVESERASWDS